MAESSDASGKTSSSVCITEDDIPGAKLSKESPEDCNCWMLRRWLQCMQRRSNNREKRQCLFKGMKLKFDVKQYS